MNVLNVELKNQSINSMVWNKGKKLSEEHKRKIRERMSDPNVVEKMRKSHLGKTSAWKGRSASKETRLKMSLAKLGRPSHRKGKKFSQIAGENNYQWKGENVSYRNLHRWVEKVLGKPIKCAMLDEECSGRLEWSNISGQYKRDPSDWQRLCKIHHVKYDKNKRDIKWQQQM